MSRREIKIHTAHPMHDYEIDLETGGYSWKGALISARDKIFELMDDFDIPRDAESN